MGGWKQDPELLEKPGKHSFGKGCLYPKRLDDLNMPILKRLIRKVVKNAKNLAQAGVTHCLPAIEKHEPVTRILGPVISSFSIAHPPESQANTETRL